CAASAALPAGGVWSWACTANASDSVTRPERRRKLMACSGRMGVGGRARHAVRGTGGLFQPPRGRSTKPVRGGAGLAYHARVNIAPFRTAAYLKSVHHLRDLPPDDGREVAISGRSNAGKSSAINAIAQQNSLARTSKTPG